jgi:hypothetical protein
MAGAYYWEDQPEGARTDSWDDAIAHKQVHEQVPEIGFDRIQRGKLIV